MLILIGILWALRLQTVIYTELNCMRILLNKKFYPILSARIETSSIHKHYFNILSGALTPSIEVWAWIYFVSRRASDLACWRISPK